MSDVDWHLRANDINLSAWVGRNSRSQPPAAPPDLLDNGEITNGVMTSAFTPAPTL